MFCYRKFVDRGKKRRLKEGKDGIALFSIPCAARRVAGGLVGWGSLWQFVAILQDSLHVIVPERGVYMP